MYHLMVLTKKKTYFDGSASSLIVPGTIGYMQILKDHSPIIASLKPGKLQVRNEQGEEILYAISGGIFEFNENNALVLADTLESSDEIDIERAEAALKKALHRLEFDSETIDIHRTMQAILRAQIRIQVYEKGRSQ